MNKLCIDSIFRNTLWPNFELIIIDNASADETPGYLTKVEQFHENVRIILNKENLGFARGNNQGIQIAQGEYIVLLNNDTMVTRGWLSRLLQHLLRDPKAGMVGPVTNAIANEAKIDVDYITLDDMESFAEQRYWEYAGKNFPIKVLALFCALARKETLEKIGMLDERFKIGMFEDDDLALRLQQAGFHSLCAQDVFIHHFLSESFKLLGEDGFSEVFQVNRKRFEEKWSQGWSPHKYSDKAG